MCTMMIRNSHAVCLFASLFVYHLVAPSAASSECKETQIGVGYTGTLAATISGHTCQSWALDTPVDHDHNSQDANYCRNPDNEIGGPWCYTTVTNVRWDYCDVTRCGAVQNSAIFLSRHPSFPAGVLVDGVPDTCTPASVVTVSQNLVVRADLGVDADYASAEVIVYSESDEYLAPVQVYTNVGELYDNQFSGYFEYCEFVGHHSSDHVHYAKLYYYCACARSQCRYMYFRWLRNAASDLQPCEVHVYGNQEYNFNN